MRKWLLSICIFSFGAALVAQDVDAKRLGGGRSVGAQRSVTPPPAAAPAKPAQPQAAPQQAPQGSRWGVLGGILGGLALGGLLGYLFSGSGLLGIALFALLVFGFVALLRSARRRAEPVQYAGIGQETVAAPPPSQASGLEAPPVAAARAVPPGFDAMGFLRAAKLNFIRLQAANDAGQLDAMREFTTREMFDELRTDVQAGSHTDVVTLNADLLELATEKDKHWASVRFSGMVREAPGGEPVGFEEVWNLVKPVDGSSGWLLAGIQQMH